MFKSIVVGAVLIGTATLAGCSSSNTDLDKLDQQVQTLDQKVDVLQQDVLNLKEETKEVRAEAERANNRLDNQVTTYRK